MAALEQLFSYGRADHLFTRIMFWAMALAVGVVTLAPGLAAWFRGSELVGTVRFDPDRDQAIAPSGALSPNHAWWSGEVSVSLVSPSTSDRLLVLAPGLVITALTIALTFLLLNVLSGVAAGDPFRASTARSLRIIALAATVALVVLPLAHVAREATFVAALSDIIGPDEAVLRMPLGTVLALIATAVVASGLAGAFTRGTRLEQDNEGLV